jgi:uncharacterized protein
MQPNVTPLHSSLYARLRHDPEILKLIDHADSALGALGYTDHGRRHATVVALAASKLLASLGHDARQCDLAAVAGLTHDLGNCAGRPAHAAAGAVFVYHLLTSRGVDVSDAATIMTAVANHDENAQGAAVDAVSAALIIADKADIHRSRVRTRKREEFDVHDRVNYAVTRADLDACRENNEILLRLTVDTEFAEPADILDLFNVRFAMSSSAASMLGCSYGVIVNGSSIL